MEHRTHESKWSGQVGIEPGFLFRMVLGQPEKAAAFRREIAAISKEDPMYAVRAGAEWADGAFNAVADDIFPLLHANAHALNAARQQWSAERFSRLTGFIDERSGNLSLADAQGGELSLADKQGGELSLTGEAEKK